MDDEDMASDVQMEDVTKQSTVISSLNPLRSCNNNGKSRSKKSLLRADSAGLANTINFCRPKPKSKGCSGSFTLAFERDSRESIEKQSGCDDIVPSSQGAQADTLTTPICSSVGHVTECATTWSIVGFVLSSVYPACEAVFASIGDVQVTAFYGWILLPISTTAMAISFVMKPRMNSLPYMFFLHFQYLIFSFGSRVSDTCGEN